MRTNTRSAFGRTCAALFIGALIGVGQAHATIVTLSPDSVNRIIGPNVAGGIFVSTNFTDVFSTHPAGPQESLVQVSNASLLAALAATLGPASGYVINSATLTVGSPTDDYLPGVIITGHLVLQSYTSSQVTWNNRTTGTPWASPGLLSGTDFASATATTGTPTPGNPTTETDFTGLGSVVQGWLNNATPNLGLFFLASSVDPVPGNRDFTDAANVVWTLDATVIPEPSTLLLIAVGGLVLGLRRRAQK